MSQIYVKRGAVVEAEPFDPKRRDQGVMVAPDPSDPDGFLSATLTSRGRRIAVRRGDVIVRDALGPYPISQAAFDAMYQPLDDVIVPEGGRP